MTKQPLRSILHLQMGQEVLYLLMTIGLMSSLVLLIYARFLHAEKTDVTSIKEELVELEVLRDLETAKVSALRDEAAELAALRSKLLAELVDFRDSAPERHPSSDDQPPIITLTEAQGYSFPSGSAELSNEFRDQLARQIIPLIGETSRRYNAQIIEVIGHTDEIPVRSVRSTIDQDLLNFLNLRSSAEPVVADNVGLGMVRAAAVSRELRRDPRLDALTILPLSAGHTTSTHHELSPGVSPPADDQHRRRIEIRVRRHFDD